MTILKEMMVRDLGGREQGRWAKWTDSDPCGQQGGRVSRESIWRA